MNYLKHNTHYGLNCVPPEFLYLILAPRTFPFASRTPENYYDSHRTISRLVNCSTLWTLGLKYLSICSILWRLGVQAFWFSINKFVRKKWGKMEGEPIALKILTR